MIHRKVPQNNVSVKKFLPSSKLAIPQNAPWYPSDRGVESIPQNAPWYPSVRGVESEFSVTLR